MIPLLLTQGIILFQDTSLVYVLSRPTFSEQRQILSERDALG